MVKGRIIKSCRCSIFPKSVAKPVGAPTNKHAAKPVGQQTKSGKTSGPHKNNGKTSGQNNTNDKTSGPKTTRQQHQWAQQIQWATKASGNTGGHKTKAARPPRSKPATGKSSEGQNLPATCVFGTIDYRLSDDRLSSYI